jgi:hypothetical protein
VELGALIREVDERVPGGDPIARVAAARDMCVELSELGDRLVDHFVEAARHDGCSWAQIGSALGVSRQGAQQRHGGLLRRARRGLISGVARFGTDARRAVVEAQGVARTMGHDHVDTGHLLLGILASGPEAAGATILERCGVTASEVELEIVSATGRGTEPPRQRHIPFSAAAKKALELSLREAIAAGHKRIGTEHLLLALARDKEGAVGLLLARHGIDRKRVAAFVRERSGG